MSNPLIRRVAPCCTLRMALCPVIFPASPQRRWRMPWNFWVWALIAKYAKSRENGAFQQHFNSKIWINRVDISWRNWELKLLRRFMTSYNYRNIISNSSFMQILDGDSSQVIRTPSNARQGMQPDLPSKNRGSATNLWPFNGHSMTKSEGNLKFHRMKMGHHKKIDPFFAMCLFSRQPSNSWFRRDVLVPGCQLVLLVGNFKII